MKILITGGCGFIGSNFIRHIIAKYPNYTITNLDKLTYAGNLENLKDLEHNPRYNFVKGDICDDKLADQLTKKNEIVINFAAESHVDNSINTPLVFTRTNVLGTHVLLESARRNGVKKFIQISTDEVYGSVSKGSSSEPDKLEPNSPYSASKAASDMLARSYFVTYGFPVIITRSSNNYGPYQYPEKVIPLFVTNLLEGKKVPLYGDGLNIRDWIYVLDNCKAIDFVLHKGEIGEIYNIGGGNNISNLELTNKILKSMGKNVNFIEYVKDRLGHDRRYSLNCAKLKKLGWMPQYDFENAIKETILWYKNNEKWWKKLKK